MRTMKKKTNGDDSPPSYLMESFIKHMDIVFKEFPCMPYESSLKLYNAYQIARNKEWKRIKKYLENGKRQ